eukprot:XP_005615740.1 pantetheinase-like [Canis lupus familiaris]
MRIFSLVSAIWRSKPATAPPRQHFKTATRNQSVRPRDPRTPGVGVGPSAETRGTRGALTCSLYQQSSDFSMITSRLLVYVAVLVLCVIKVSSRDTFIAAVYEHAVKLPNATLVPVSHEEALAVMNQNLDLLEAAITSAANQVPSLKHSGFHQEKDGVLGDRVPVKFNYTFGKHVSFHYDMKTKEGKLLLSQLDSYTHHPIVVNWTSYASSIKAFPTENQEFTGTAFFDEFTFLELTRVTGNYTVCQKKLCCHLSYKMSEKRTDEVYALGAFDGLHVVEGRYYLQICTLLKCKTAHVHTCGGAVETASTRFDMFSLSGTFGTQYVFPEVLLSETQLAPGEFQVSSDGRLFSMKPLSGPLLTVTLFGRIYEKDQTLKASSDPRSQVPGVMLLVIIPIVCSLSW